MMTERDKIFQTLTKAEKAILWRYEHKHGCGVPAAAIIKVIEDEKEIGREKWKRGKKKK